MKTEPAKIEPLLHFVEAACCVFKTKSPNQGHDMISVPKGVVHRRPLHMPLGYEKALI